MRSKTGTGYWDRGSETVRITGTGHASMRIDTGAGSILCDPWVNPA
jgi:UDP-MurNAc hydroxylase